MRGTDWTPEGLRSFVDKIAEHHDAGRLPFALHLPGGNEEQLIDIFAGINEGDYVLSTQKHVPCTSAWSSSEEVEQKILSGRGMFMFDRERNFYVSAIIGGPVAIAVGIAWALKRGFYSGVYCFLGDGTEDTGHFAEAVRYVDGFDLPCTFIIEETAWQWKHLRNVVGALIKTYNGCLCHRYHYTKSRPHIRTGNFADLKVMKETMKTDEEYFPLLPKRGIQTLVSFLLWM